MPDKNKLTETLDRALTDCQKGKAVYSNMAGRESLEPTSANFGEVITPRPIRIPRIREEFCHICGNTRYLFVSLRAGFTIAKHVSSTIKARTSDNEQDGAINGVGRGRSCN